VSHLEHHLLLLLLCIKANCDRLIMRLYHRAARRNLDCEREFEFWLSRGEGVLVGVKAENAFCYRYDVDHLEPGDPIPVAPPHLLEEA
jgi:hypothetical protein